MWGILFVTLDIYSDFAWGTHHCNSVVLVRNRTIGAYVVVAVTVPSWLSGFLCYHGYKPAHAQQAPLWEGLWRQGCSTAERKKEGAVLIQIFKKVIFFPSSGVLCYVSRWASLLISSLFCFTSHVSVSVNQCWHVYLPVFTQNLAKLNTSLGLNFFNQHTNFCKYISFYPMTICSVTN